MAVPKFIGKEGFKEILEAREKYEENKKIDNSKRRTKRHYYDINSPNGIALLFAQIKIPKTPDGIHRPLFWRNGSSWGISYRILAPVSNPIKLTPFNCLKYTLFQVNWKHARGWLLPEDGYSKIIGAIKTSEPEIQELLTTIDNQI